MRSGVHRFVPQERVYFGRPADETLAAEAERLNARRVFLVCSPSLESSAYLSRIRLALGDRTAGAFFGMQPHSPRQSVIGAANAARAAKADLILAVGGGSVIDGAKVALQCLWLGYESLSDLDRLPKGVAPDRSPEVPGAVAPIVRMVAVPTTFSGAEFTSLAGVTNRERGLKEGFDHPLQAPVSVALDPEATLGVPDWVLMSTGIRAVDHCVETYCSNHSQPYADAMALHGLRTLSESLPALKSDPTSLDSRLQCQLGMWLAIQGVAAGVPVGASHGIGRMLGGALGVPHGRTSCVLLTSVLRWNVDVNAARQAELSAALGKPAKPLADIVEDLVRALGEPSALRDVGVREDQLAELADKAFASGFVAHNPKPVRDASDVLTILKMAF